MHALYRIFVSLLLFWVIPAASSGIGGSSGVGGGTTTHTHTNSSTGGDSISATTITASSSINAPSITASSVFIGGAFSATTGTFSGTTSSTKSCVSGYVRVGPNLCMKTSALAPGGIVRDTLTTLTDPTTESKALIVFTSVSARSGNAVALRSTELLFYSNSILQQNKRSYAYEHVAVAAGNVLDNQDGLSVIVKNTNYQVQFSDDVANQGTVDLEIRGYND